MIPDKPESPWARPAKGHESRICHSSLSGIVAETLYRLRTSRSDRSRSYFQDNDSLQEQGKHNIWGLPIRKSDAPYFHITNLSVRVNSSYEWNTTRIMTQPAC